MRIHFTLWPNFFPWKCQIFIYSTPDNLLVLTKFPHLISRKVELKRTDVLLYRLQYSLGCPHHCNLRVLLSLFGLRPQNGWRAVLINASPGF